jgi:hypothetical protein
LNLPERSGGNFNHFTFGECHEERGAFAKGELVAIPNGFHAHFRQNTNFFIHSTVFALTFTCISTIIEESPEVLSMNLEEYRIACGWSKHAMAREAKMDFNTLNRAINGEHVSLGTADKIATAISQKLGRSVPWQQIEGLNVKV